jgi:hypothetical protein
MKYKLIVKGKVVFESDDIYECMENGNEYYKDGYIIKQ